MTDKHLYDGKTLYIIEDGEVAAKAKGQREVSIGMELLKEKYEIMFYSLGLGINYEPML